MIDIANLRWCQLNQREVYVEVNLGMIGLWLLVSLIAAAGLPNLFPLTIPTAFAVLWNCVSYRRVFSTHFWFLHLAPYVTIAGAVDLLWAVLEGANNGPWVYGFKPWPVWEEPLQAAGFALVLAWPAATVTLGVVQGRAAPTKG